jgi:hypothetical protein
MWLKDRRRGERARSPPVTASPRTAMMPAATRYGCALLADLSAAEERATSEEATRNVSLGAAADGIDVALLVPFGSIMISSPSGVSECPGAKMMPSPRWQIPHAVSTPHDEANGHDLRGLLPPRPPRLHPRAPDASVRAALWVTFALCLGMGLRLRNARAPRLSMPPPATSVDVVLLVFLLALPGVLLP